MVIDDSLLSGISVIDQKILVSALASEAINTDKTQVIKALSKQSSAVAIAQTFGCSWLIRELRLSQSNEIDKTLPLIDRRGSEVFYFDRLIGSTKILYKSPLPGEWQARLAIESAIDRFLEYLQKVLYIVALDESDHHVRVFIPKTQESVNFNELWENFLKYVAFSIYGDLKHDLPGLLHTFVASINTIKLAKKEKGGFGILRVPIVTNDQAIIMAAWYYSILKYRLKKSKLTDVQIEKLKVLQDQNRSQIEKLECLGEQFTDIGKGQINPTTANINQIFTEIQNLLKGEPLDSLPSPLLNEIPAIPELRSPGDDTGKFCYSCGLALKRTEKKWETLRISFEASTQRLQSSNTEKQPRICSTCLALSFVCPIKFSHRSIVLKLIPRFGRRENQIKLKDYIRLLANKEVNLSAGKYVMLPSEILQKGKDRIYVSDKFGKVQYSLVKLANIFASEVLADFKFALITNQSNEPIYLESRHLIFIKGLIDCYKQSTVIPGKEINLTLGDAVRYMQQDLPFLAEYTITKSLPKDSNLFSDLTLEQVRAMYWKVFTQDLGDDMTSDNPLPLPKRAKLYQDVAAMTGLTYAFVQSLENTAKKSKEQAKDPKYSEREVSKIIEKVDDPVAFNYYATLGDENKTNVQARLFCDSDNTFIYSQTQWLLEQLDIKNREAKDEKGRRYLQLYADDVLRAYQHFAISKDYVQEKDWKDLTYNLKLSLYARFPELVRKLKSTSEN